MPLSVFLSFFFVLQGRLPSSYSFISLSWSRITDKLAINWKISLEFDFSSSLLL